MAEIPQTPSYSAQELEGREVVAYGFQQPWYDDPTARPGPFRGELYSVTAPFGGTVTWYVGSDQVDPDTVIPADVNG